MSKTEIGVKALIKLLRRTTRSKFTTLLMNNRMLMQCYDINIDSTIGMNYILYIPSTPEYEHPFYDETLIIEPRRILAAYKNGHDGADQYRRRYGLKPKDLTEDVHFKVDGGRCALKFTFQVGTDYLKNDVVPLGQYPIDQYRRDVENCITSFENLLRRVKPGGACFIFDGIRNNIENIVKESDSVYNYHVRYCGGKKSVNIPMLKSMITVNNPDRFLYSIQETYSPEIYTYTYQFTKNGIIDQYWGYILDY